jgi:hypothetical protein
MDRRPVESSALRRELPWLVVLVGLLVVLLHANAPEVWFWFGALLVLLLWRCLAWRGRWRQRQEAGGLPSSSSGSDTGPPG